VAAAAGLDAGLLVGRDDELAPLQGPTGEPALVQVQHHLGLGGEVGSAGEDPRAVLPRLDRILCQPAPQGGDRDVADQPTAEQLLAQLGKAPPAERHPAGGRQLAGDGLGVGDHRGQVDPRPARPRPILQAVQPRCAEPLAPLDHRVDRDPQPTGDRLGGVPAVLRRHGEPVGVRHLPGQPRRLRGLRAAKRATDRHPREALDCACGLYLSGSSRRRGHSTREPSRLA
jgi:hypothetical protein